LKIIKSTQQASNEQHQEFIARRCWKTPRMQITRH
jgi:hypothetical protein